MRILIVEDDLEIAEIEKDYLVINGFEVDHIADGNAAVAAIQSSEYDLILLDIMLPGKSGIEICKEIRSKVDIPIIMVTAKSEPLDKILGLGLGADDYIGKPFDIGELVARVKANIAQYKRVRQNRETDVREAASGNCIKSGDLRIYPDAYLVYVKDNPVKLTTREFELLSFLAQNANTVFTKEQLFEKVWGVDYMSDNATVTVHINHIREKIEPSSSNPKYIETIWGVGYRFNRIPY